MTIIYEYRLGLRRVLEEDGESICLIDSAAALQGRQKHLCVRCPYSPKVKLHIRVPMGTQYRRLLLDYLNNEIRSLSVISKQIYLWRTSDDE